MVKRVCARVLTGEGLGRRTAAPLPSGTGIGGAQRRRGGGRPAACGGVGVRANPAEEGGRGVDD